MGTSSNNPGSNDRSPLVPPHADAEPGKPLPKPDKNRFKEFRTSLGKYVKTGDKSYLNKGLSSYAGKATGGVGHRRFGTAVDTGGALISALSGFQQGKPIEDIEGLNQDKAERFSEAVGKPLDEAIEILADCLAPDGEDSDTIRDALVHALSESLEGLDEEFDYQTLDEEIYTNTILCYLTEVVFQEVVLESGESFDKAESPEVLHEREDVLRETVKAAIDNHLSEHIQDQISSLSSLQIRNIQLAALKDVFAEWEAHTE